MWRGTGPDLIGGVEDGEAGRQADGFDGGALFGVEAGQMGRFWEHTHSDRAVGMRGEQVPGGRTDV
jgi:hypothetical protein